MALRFFIVSVQDSGGMERELNSFLARHRVLSVERHFVNQGPSSYWGICIDYLESSAPTAGQDAGRGKVDYKQVLSPEQFNLFARLRDLRKTIAQREAVPVYTIFTNEQLAQMVQKEVTSKTALEEIAGVGDARVEKYGPEFLAALADNGKGTDEASGPAV